MAVVVGFPLGGFGDYDLLEVIEKSVRDHFPIPVTVFTHLEPVEDPVSHSDIGIDRQSAL